MSDEVANLLLLFWEIIKSVGIPAAVLALLLRRFEKRLDKRDAAQAQKEEDNKKYDILLLKRINTSVEIGTATAKAVQRIPNARCNGDMTAALENVKKADKEFYEFLDKQGINHLHEHVE